MSRKRKAVNNLLPTVKQICYKEAMKEDELLAFIHSISRRTGFTGVGDDAAVLADGLVVSTDQFIENTHFTWSQMSAEEIGHKALVQALSDLAAMAAQPIGVLCSTAWPQADDEKIRQVFLGIEAACREYQVPLVGGDISRSQASQTYMDFTVLGKTSRPLLQSGARPGDLIAVSGPIGGAMGGFRTLNEGESALTRAFKKPRARIGLALKLAEKNVLTSLTDISDSLSKSLYHLSRQSHCGVTIDLDKIPRLSELETLCEARQWPIKDFLLSGGEDYELLMTLDKNTANSVILDHGLTVIGQTQTGPNTYNENKKNYPLPEVGWDPFVL
jgi:thiamine-monophosphate kinase